MASQTSVKEYLACWFQLGKSVSMDGGRVEVLPQPVFHGDRYSPDFERCWQEIILPNCDRCVLSGTVQTVAELLQVHWSFQSCARCTMPTPQPERGMPPETCPCADLPDWPNLDLPVPRIPSDTRRQLQRIRDRLARTASAADSERNGLSYALELQERKQHSPEAAPKPPTPGYYPLPDQEPQAAVEASSLENR